MKYFTLMVLAVISSATFAAGKNTHLGTSEQQAAAIKWNRGHMRLLSDLNWQVQRPFSEIEKTGYVAISGDDIFELPQLREAIAKNLPADVTLVVYVGSNADVSALKADLGGALGDRLKFLLVEEDFNADPIWARDSLPFPVHMQSGFGLVNSLYPQSFEPDQDFQKALGYEMTSTGEYFRGGNLLFDMDGNCFSENVNETAGLNNPQQYLTQYFGCKSVTLLNQRGGIGDIDERIKFLTGKDVLTDDRDYADILAQKGYTVHMMPSTGRDDETYMNTLYVNGTVFVPQMKLPSDQSALDAYRALGMNPVGVVTKQMADQGAGNIHCVTMNYPPGSFVASPLGGDFIQFK